MRWDEGKRFPFASIRLGFVGKPGRSGTQWIGWDPQAKQIRSWVFDSEEEFGQGRWTRSGNTWIVKASGITGDGLATSSTQLIEPINKDSLKMQSTDRIVGTELLPDIDEVVMVRSRPRPIPTGLMPPGRKPKADAPNQKSDRP